MQRIVPHLWFDHQAEEAAEWYTSIFPRGEIKEVARVREAAAGALGRPPGSALTVQFDLGGSPLLALNGGPAFQHTPAISFYVTLESEAEVDALWAALSEGGTVRMPLDAYPWSPRYGWVDDRYGVSWQLSFGTRDDVGGQTLVPALLFVGPQHGRAEEALRAYTSIFQPSQVRGILHHDGSGPDPAGTVMHAQFSLQGVTFMVMDSAHAHDFGFTEALSFVVRCETQEEVDRYWNALSAVPEAEQCGWLKDAFGVSWQVVPNALPKLLQDPDPEKAGRVMGAMLQMKKLDIAALERASGG